MGNRTVSDLPDALPGPTDGSIADNLRRASWASAGVKAYAQGVYTLAGTFEEPAVQGITDLLADLHHLADHLGEDFDAWLATSELNYAAESSE